MLNLHHKCVHPGLSAISANQFDSFDSNDKVPDPIENGHHGIFACLEYSYARKHVPVVFSSSVVSVGYLPANLHSGGEIFHSGQNDAYEHEVV